MGSKLKTAALRAILSALSPLVSLLLKNGVMFREFNELAKRAYVDVAGREYGKRGRPTNVSRVALLTGLDRKEIKRLRETLADGAALAAQTREQDRISRLLSGWYQDPAFSDIDGQPRALAAAGTEGFPALARKYGGDVPVSTMLKELKESRHVVATDDGRLRPRKRYYMPAKSDPDALLRSGSILQDLGRTAVHNLYRDAKTPSRFEGRATNRSVAAKDVAAFHAFVETQGQQFLENVDAWLSRHESTAAEDPTRLGLGVYWIQD